MRIKQDKTGYIQCGSNKQFAKCLCDTISVTNSTIPRSLYIKYLGSYFDATLSFKTHIQMKCGIASKYVQCIAFIRRFISQDITNQLVCSLEMSHLYFGNSILIGIPKITLQNYQKVQNWAEEITLCRRRQDSSMEALFDLHWLPITYRINFKIGCLVLKALHDQALSYICDLLTRQHFWFNTKAAALSKNVIQLKVPQTKMYSFEDKSFSVYGPHLWNGLPIELGTISDYMLFTKHFQIYLFSIAFADLL